jgi:hypothetical protein
MSIVELRLGDMFDGPSDLIVLPCSTVGSVTPFVREKLRNYRIPYPKPVMNLATFRFIRSRAARISHSSSLTRSQWRPQWRVLVRPKRRFEESAAN